MLYRVREAISRQIPAYAFRRRVILPFKCHVLKITVGNQTYTDFQPPYDKDIAIEQAPLNTIVTFMHLDSLREVDRIVMVVADYDANLADPNTHIPIVLRLGEGHQVPVEYLSKDELYII